MANSTFTLRITGIYMAEFLRNVSNAVDPARVKLTNNVKFDSEIKELTFEGDGTETTSYQLTKITAELTSDAMDLAAMTEIYGVSVVTGQSGETERAYFGTTADQGGTPAGLKIYCTAVDDATNTNKKVVIVFPVGSLSAFIPPELKNADKAPITFKFSAQRTDKDIAGVALPSVPVGGAFWYYAVLSS